MLTQGQRKRLLCSLATANGRAPTMECGGLPPLFNTAGLDLNRKTDPRHTRFGRVLESGGKPPHAESARKLPNAQMTSTALRRTIDHKGGVPRIVVP